MNEDLLNKLNKKLDAIAKATGIYFCPNCGSEHYERQYRAFTSDCPGLGSPLTFVPLNTRKCEECGHEGNAT
jgi:hypothetical protein